MDPFSTVEWNALTAYLFGDATPEAAAAVERWAAECPEHAQLVRQLREALGSIGRAKEPSFDVARIVQAAREIGQGDGAPSVKRVRRVAAFGSVRDAMGLGMYPLRSALPSSWWRRAAYVSSALAVAGAAIIGAYWRTTTSGAPDVSVERYTTRAGQRAQIMLLDGTRVQLAPQTVLAVSRSTSGTTATLVGEAFFTVPHRSSGAFVVRTGRVTTRVLGTAFDVRRYSVEPFTRIFVTEGKVSTGVSRQVIVTQNMLASVNDSSTIVSVRPDRDEPTAWIRGRLIFHNAPVGDVLAAVSRWYGVTIRLTDPALAHDLLTTELDVNRTRSDFLALLETVLTVRITSVGDTLVVTPTTAVRKPPNRNTLDASFTQKTEIGR